MLNERELSSAIGSTAYDVDGDKIGTVGHFFADDRTGAPTWVAVTTGLFGTRHSVVPAGEATFADGALRLPVRKEAVRDAPQPPDPDHLDPATEAELRRHYGLAPSAPAAPAAAAGPAVADDLPPGAQAPGADAGTSGRHEAVQDAGPLPEADRAADREAAPAVPAAVPGDGAMTRTEEQLRVSTERVVTGRVRLVKYVVTEEVQVTVPIRREEVRLEEVPAGGDDRPVSTGESLLPPGAEHGSGLPEELVLHAERPVVSVEVVPVERVRVRTVTVTDQEQVTERVQREQIVVDQSGAGGVGGSVSPVDRP